MQQRLFETEAVARHAKVADLFSEGKEGMDFIIAVGRDGGNSGFPRLVVFQEETGRTMTWARGSLRGRCSRCRCPIFVNARLRGLFAHGSNDDGRRPRSALRLQVKVNLIN